MKKISVLVLFVAFLTATGAACAAGGNAAFKGTAVIQFGPADVALMKATVRRALDAEPGSPGLDWNNDTSKASGRVESLVVETWQGMPCRQLRITNTYLRQTEQGVYRFCEKPAGRWKLAGPVHGKS